LGHKFSEDVQSPKVLNKKDCGLSIKPYYHENLVHSCQIWNTYFKSLPNMDVLFYDFEEYKVPINITITNPFNLKVEVNSLVPSTKIRKDIQVDYQRGTNKRMHEHLVVDGQGVPTLAKCP
jgi:hypothetical protein